jgi:hypothetical protein
MVTVKPTEFAVFRDLFLKAAIKPEAETPRYRWSVDPSGSCGLPGSGSEIKLNCSNTGTYTIKLEVTNADGAKLGEATQSVNVSISQATLDGSKKSQSAYHKLSQAKQLVAQGKLDEGISAVGEAQSLDPKNSEAVTLASKWKSEKAKILEHTAGIKKLLEAEKLDEAEKELKAAKTLHPKYQPVVDAEKLFLGKKDLHDKKKAQSGQLLQKAKQEVHLGKLDEALASASEAVKVDPKNAEATKYIDFIKKEKETADQGLEGVKKLMDEARFPEASNALVPIKNKYSYYPPVQKMDTDLGQAWRGWDSKVQEAVGAVRMANERREFAKALELAKKARDIKPGPYLTTLTQQEEWAKRWETEKEQKRKILQSAEEKIKNHDYVGGERLFVEGFGNFNNLWAMTDTEPNYYNKIRGEALTKNKRLQELLPVIQKAAEQTPLPAVSVLEGALKTVPEAIALQPNNPKMKDYQYQITERLQKAKEDEARLKEGNKYREAGRAEENTYRGQVSYLQSQPNQWGETFEEDMHKHLRLAIENYTTSLKFIPDQQIEKHIKALNESLAGRQKFLDQVRTAKKLRAEADQTAQEARKEQQFEAGQHKFDQAVEKYNKSLGLWRPPDAETLGRIITNLEYEKHDRMVRKYRADAEILEKENRIMEAIPVYEKALASYHPITPANDRMQLQVKIQDLRNRITAAKQWRDQGESQQKQNRIVEAANSYRQSLKFLPDKALEQYVETLEGEIKKETDRKHQADRLWQEGSALFNQGRPADSLVKFKESVQYWSDGDRRQYVQDLDSRKAKAQSLRDEGAKFQQQNLLKEALARFNESLKYWPDPALKAHMAAVEAKINQNQEFENKKTLAKQLRDEAYALQRQNRLREAIGKYKESLVVWPDSQLADYVRQLEANLAASAVQTSSSPPTSTTGQGDWTGTWRASGKDREEVTFSFNQQGGQLTGLYTVVIAFTAGKNEVFKGHFDGTVSGKKANGNFVDDKDSRNIGTWEAVMAADSQSFQVTIRGGGVVQSYTATRLGGMSALPSSPGSSASSAFIVAEITNKSSQNTHIFIQGESFGPSNRFAPGERRSVTVQTPPNGSITFVAGRDGRVMTTKTWQGDPGNTGRMPNVIFDDSNPYDKLVITTRLR